MYANFLLTLALDQDVCKKLTRTELFGNRFIAMEAGVS
jgi:hypothetical protein